MSTETGSAGVKRRDFLKVLGATGAATSLVGCTSENVGRLIPYVVNPDNTVPQVSNYYATICREGLEPVGVLAEVRDGRVIKLEGNPQHPANRGALVSPHQLSSGTRSSRSAPCARAATLRPSPRNRARRRGGVPRTRCSRSRGS